MALNQLGSAFATISSLVVSVLFSCYAANFGSDNKTYGLLGAVIGFMEYSVIVILLGVELDVQMQHQTARGTTTRPAVPHWEGARLRRSAVGRASPLTGIAGVRACAAT